MDSKKLNKIMNCNCLQHIIENDKNKHTLESIRFNEKNIQEALGGRIILQCLTRYRSINTNLENNRILKDRQEDDYCGIPFFYCPICGTKTKENTIEGDFYHKNQNI
jgi:hypothetical protein